jgi:hypothetical protein
MRPWASTTIYLLFTNCYSRPPFMFTTVSTTHYSMYEASFDLTFTLTRTCGNCILKRCVRFRLQPKSIYPCALPTVVKLKRYCSCLLTSLSAEYRQKESSELWTLTNELQIVIPLLNYDIKKQLFNREINSNSHVLRKENFRKDICPCMYKWYMANKILYGTG